ncbi:MAG: DNA polymerase Y family protein [Steroidobacteraceae bacterium]
MKSLLKSRQHELLPATPPPGTRAPHAVSISAAQRVQAAELWVAVHLSQPAVLETLAAAALQYTPRVSLEPPDGLLFEIRSSLLLFGGVQGLCADFRTRCGTGLEGAVLSLAPTPLAALALARAGSPVCIDDTTQLAGAVAGLPLRALRWSDDTLTRLLSMGVRTIGEAQRLPRAGFARRFGPELLVCLDRLLGRRSDPRSAFRLRERFRAMRELYYETSAQDRIMAVVQLMLREMEAFLRQRQCGVTVLELRLMHRGDVPDTRCLLRLALPQHLAEEFAHLLQEHLARLRLPAPVRSCRLRTGRLLELASASGGLWQPGEHGGVATLQIPAFIERLRARLGNEAVYGVCLVPGHRPEAAWGITEPELKSTRPQVAPDWSPQHRPLWLLREPRQLVLRAERPCHHGHPVQLIDGPERVETGWWEGRDIGRDYYVARGAQGEKLWVFRERNGAHHWFLHGLFG